MRIPATQPPAWSQTIFSNAHSAQSVALQVLPSLIERVTLYLILLLISSFASSAHAVTYDDSESIIPEFYIMFKGASAGSSSLSVECDAYKTNSTSGTGVMYKETINLSSSGTGWSAPASLYINRGMPLDQVATLIVNGSNVAEYKIFLNTPDAKYVPCVAASEQHLIDYTLGSLPQTHYVWFTRAGDKGAEAAKASSAMPGWINYKLGLGYGRTGKSLGYITFLRGNEATLPGGTDELTLTNYTASGVPHSQVYTPRMVFDIYWDATYSESGFNTGAYRANAYDRASQAGAARVDGSGVHYLDFTGITQIVSYVLNYNVSSTQAEMITKVKRTEGTSAKLSTDG